MVFLPFPCKTVHSFLLALWRLEVFPRTARPPSENGMTVLVLQFLGYYHLMPLLRPFVRDIEVLLAMDIDTVECGTKSAAILRLEIRDLRCISDANQTITLKVVCMEH